MWKNILSIANALLTLSLSISTGIERVNHDILRDLKKSNKSDVSLFNSFHAQCYLLLYNIVQLSLLDQSECENLIETTLSTFYVPGYDSRWEKRFLNAWCQQLLPWIKRLWPIQRNPQALFVYWRLGGPAHGIVTKTLPGGNESLWVVWVLGI